jgi:hypothetical protein
VPIFYWALMAASMALPGCRLRRKVTGAFRAFSAQVFVSCGGEIVATFLRGEEVTKGGGDGLPEVGNGSRRRSAQRGFELGEGPFDGIEVGTVRRQAAQGSRPARSMNQSQADSGIPYDSIGQCPASQAQEKSSEDR